MVWFFSEFGSTETRASAVSINDSGSVVVVAATSLSFEAPLGRHPRSIQEHPQPLKRYSQHWRRTYRPNDECTDGQKRTEINASIHDLETKRGKRATFLQPPGSKHNIEYNLGIRYISIEKEYKRKQETYGSTTLDGLRFSICLGDGVG